MPTICPGCSALVVLGALRCARCGARQALPGAPMLGLMDVDGFGPALARLARVAPRLVLRNALVDIIRETPEWIDVGAMLDVYRELL